MAVNAWARFKKLLPVSPLVIVTVDSINTDGTSTVTTASGGVMRVFGDGVAVGNKAFVRGGIIQGEAPNLTHYDVDV